ncbi:MAG: adenylate kinase [Phototrophicales bacterium]|nr:MAG: adenylate kinase [Phototrophicales bacterium]
MGTYIVLIGVQGSGKGTQAAVLQEKLGLLHISTGDLFRAMKTEDTPLARKVQELMAKGELISDEITNQMVEERLSKPDAARGAILDGYPRSIGQAQFLDELLAKQGDRVVVVPVLQLDREVAIKRVEGRRYSQDKKRVYNIYFNPPKNEGVDDVDGKPLIQRDDDVREAVERRIDLYYQTTQPLIDYYQARGIVAEINADQPIDKVSVDLLAAIARALMQG